METIKNTLAENFGGPAHALAPEKHQFSLDQVPSLTGKVAVVTGGSEGIGFGCTHTLLTHGIDKVFVVSVSSDVVDGAVAAIREELGEDVANKIIWLQCDISNFQKVEEIAEKITNGTSRLDILINNAGRGIMSYEVTDYGVDRHVRSRIIVFSRSPYGILIHLEQIAVNHMGHVALTSHLLPLLKKTASPSSIVRIVNQSSNLHAQAPSDTKFASLEELNQDLGANAQYARSKLAVLLYARYLARNLVGSDPNILVNATHPGIVKSKMSSEDIHEPFPILGYANSVGLKPFKKDQFEGCVSAMYAATKTTRSGEYICPPAIPEPGSLMSQDEELAERLMKLTREVMKKKTYEDSAAKGCPFVDH